jgi:hypothetical protein
MSQEQLKAKLGFKDGQYTLVKNDFTEVGVACLEPEGLEVSADSIRVERAKECVVLAKRNPEIPFEDWREKYR